jgi:hypothetical protein
MIRGLIALALLVPVTFALATHPEPKKANKAQFELVNAYRECTSPNTTMDSNGDQACTPAIADALGCPGFGASGSGKLTIQKIGSATGGTQDLKVTVNATGLDPSCEGLPLDLLFSYRLTSDDCAGNSCTEPDVLDQRLGTCTVSGGKCKINTTLDTFAPGSIPTDGKNAGVEILGCGLGGLSLLDRPIRCGVFLP